MKRKSKGKTLTDFMSKSKGIYGHTKISYEQAKESKLMFYWGSNLCANGHMTYWYTSSKQCRQCSLDLAFIANHTSLAEEQQKEVVLKRKTEDLKFSLEFSKIEKGYDYDFDD